MEMRRFVGGVVFVLVFLGLSALNVSAQTTTRQSTLPRCNVGADPVNAARQPTAEEMVVVNPSDQKITYKSGNGRDVTCVLQAGVPVVVDKTTGVAGWVYGYGNPIAAPSWTPKRMPSTLIADAIRGLPGKDGYTPIKGVDYFDGKDGKDGLNGHDGKNAPPQIVKNHSHKGLWITLGTIAAVGSTVAIIAASQRYSSSTATATVIMK